MSFAPPSTTTSTANRRLHRRHLQRVDAAAVNIAVNDNIADEFADNDAADVDLFSLQMGFVNIKKKK